MMDKTGISAEARLRTSRTVSSLAETASERAVLLQGPRGEALLSSTVARHRSSAERHHSSSSMWLMLGVIQRGEDFDL